MLITVLLLVVIVLIAWKANKPKRKAKSKAHATRRPEKTPEEMAAEVKSRADFNRLLKKLERETEKVATFVSDTANDRQVERVEGIQRAIEIVERAHEWANYGEDYRPELEPPKHRRR